MFQLIKSESGQRTFHDLSVKQTRIYLQGQVRSIEQTMKDLQDAPGRTITTQQGDIRWINPESAPK
jgi:hypothetical protein